MSLRQEEISRDSVGCGEYSDDPERKCRGNRSERCADRRTDYESYAECRTGYSEISSPLFVVLGNIGNVTLSDREIPCRDSIDNPS